MNPKITLSLHKRLETGNYDDRIDLGALRSPHRQEVWLRRGFLRCLRAAFLTPKSCTWRRQTNKQKTNNLVTVSWWLCARSSFHKESKGCACLCLVWWENKIANW